MYWEQHKKELEKNSEFRKAIKDTALEYKIARALVLLRKQRGITQKELSTILKTKQSVISRVENAKTSPSLSFLKKLAMALGTDLEINFKLNNKVL